MKKGQKLFTALASFFLIIQLTSCVDNISCSSSSAIDIEKVTLPMENLETYVTNYGNRNTQPISQVPDTRCVDFDLDLLKSYLCTLENSESEYEITKLRFYLIKYPENHDGVFPAGDEEKISIAVIPIAEVDELDTEMYEINGQSAIFNHGHTIPPLGPRQSNQVIYQ